MERSAMLLSSTDLTVTEVAQQVGMNNQTHFYHLFEKTFGMSPAAYRRQAAS